MLCSLAAFDTDFRNPRARTRDPPPVSPYERRPSMGGSYRPRAPSPRRSRSPERRGWIDRDRLDRERESFRDPKREREREALLLRDRDRDMRDMREREMRDRDRDLRDRDR